jgi:transposase InsO family protein
MTARYELMEAEKATYPIVMMARLLGVARKGFYRWRKGLTGPRATLRESLKARVKRFWEESKKRHGARRIQVQLAGEGTLVSLWLVRKIMRLLGIQGIQPRSSRRTTIPDPHAKDRPDLVGRNFTPPVATSVHVGDITYLRTGEGWLYLATVIDLTTRMVVGWAMAEHMRASLAVDALTMAYDAGMVAGNAIFHTDRGAQYTSAEMAAAAVKMDVRLSCGRVGVCWDNAVAESFFASLKNEMYHQEVFPTRAKARLEVATYIEVYYNRQRPHSTLGYRTPAAAMADHQTPTHRDETTRLAA